MTWDAVLFDLDGTIADTVPAIVASYRHTFSQVLGRELDPGYLRTRIGIPLDEQLRHVGGHDQLDELRRVYLEHNLAALPREVRAFDGIPEILAALSSAGIPIGVVTSKRRHSAEVTLAACDVDIPLLVASEDTELHKPHADPLLRGCELIGVTPSTNVAYVGDTELDVQGARAAGLTPIGVTWGARDRADVAAEQPTVLCDAVDQLRTALKVL